MERAAAKRSRPASSSSAESSIASLSNVGKVAASAAASSSSSSKKGEAVAVVRAPKARVLIFGGRGLTARYRHLMMDFRALVPHHKKEAKVCCCLAWEMDGSHPSGRTKWKLHTNLCACVLLIDLPPPSSLLLVSLLHTIVGCYKLAVSNQ